MQDPRTQGSIQALNFQSTPFQDVEKLTDVHGVSTANANKLRDADVDSPVQLMGEFMVFVPTFLCKDIYEEPAVHMRKELDFKYELVQLSKVVQLSETVACLTFRVFVRGLLS